ncbi:hypothetical protein RB195_021753 [Necator americanus]|uniref:Uncharacterized protein n=1 Tax=Necator americanus TaxID=51031 RepID=A0ABR1ECJ0_NECAM
METDFTHKIVIELNSGTIFSFEGMVDRCVMTSMYWQCFLVVIIAIMGIAITSKDCQYERSSCPRKLHRECFL